MAMNKKGIFFTLAAIALAIIIILSFNAYTGYRLKDKMETIAIRIDTMNNFIKGLEEDIENAVFISGFRSLLSLEDFLMKENSAGEPAKFLGDLGTTLDGAFEEAFKQGTIGSKNMKIMENNTFLNWTNKMKIEANKTGIILDFTINDVSITQSEPWKVDVTVDLRIDVKDKISTASWTVNKDYTKKINITGFVDPLYLVNTDGVANNTIRQTIYSNWPADLSSHMFNGYYRPHSDAPSYLDRFENDLAGSAYGIESMVTQVLKSKGLPISTKSSVDYIYFSTSNPISCRVEDVADTDFRLDDPTHTGFYNTECI